MSNVSRRAVLGAAATSSIAAGARGASAQSLATPRFSPTWDSLIAQYRAPDWYRDAKFGIWAHWGVQCVPEFGDWYARKMYQQGDKFYDHHVATYGHPADFGFMDLVPRWKAEKWEPERLLDLYKSAGAKYFVAMATHHDNFDNFASSHQPWNSTRLGPKKDLIGGWERAARERGLRFGVSNHAAHAWHWWQTAYGYDAEGPRAGERYDAFKRQRADGAGKWWDGLDPQQLYTGPNMVIPDGVRTIAEANAWHDQNDRRWSEEPPSMNPAFTASWLARCTELVDKYRPDLLYFDDSDLPLGQAGLDIAAHFYNQSIAWHGDLQAVINVKGQRAQRRSAVVNDVERGFSSNIEPNPWQTDTCIGDWHYNRAVYDRNGYKTAESVIHRLCDIVSKNGNLLLSIPVRADGSIDEKEQAIVEQIGAWMAVNSEAIYGTRPWRTFGEGPTQVGEGNFSESKAAALTAEDIRFTQKNGVLYAILLGSPKRRTVTIATLAEGGRYAEGRIDRVELVGSAAPLKFTRTAEGLVVELPEAMPPSVGPALRLRGSGLV
jgi:alpha-L-fucosidase